MPEARERFLCIATEETGQEFLRQCAALQVKPTLLTVDRLRDAAWPREALEDVAVMPEGLSGRQILNTVAWMARGRRFDRVIALSERDMETAAQIREHMRVPGMGTTTASYYSDRLAMRISARESGFRVPGFCRVLNYDEMREFMERVPAPWLLKPRTAALGQEMRRLEDSERLWRSLDELGDLQSHFLLEQFMPGDIFHVESILSGRQVIFSVVHKSGKQIEPPDAGSSVFTARTVDRASREWIELTAINNGLAPSLGMVRGVTHARYLKSAADGRFYFLGIAARVGGGQAATLVETATGVDLWREWARIEVAHLRGEDYLPSPSREDYAGSILWQGGEVAADTAAFDAPEVVARLNANHSAGVIVRSTNPERVEHLVAQYSAHLAQRLQPAPEAGSSPRLCRT